MKDKELRDLLDKHDILSPGFGPGEYFSCVKHNFDNCFGDLSVLESKVSKLNKKIESLEEFFNIEYDDEARYKKQRQT